MASASFSLACSITTEIVQILLKITRYNKKKHYKTAMQLKSKLNSTESKITEALITNEISHEHVMSIINKKTSIVKRKH